MPVQWQIRTSASPNEVVDAFQSVFFYPPKAKFSDRFKFYDPTAVRNASVKLKWRETELPKATVGAMVESAGFITESISNSSRGAGSIVGSKVGMSIAIQDGWTSAHLWQAEFRSQFGISQLGQVLKDKVLEISRLLQESGATTELSKA